MVVVTATRTPDHELLGMVVNRLPDLAERARIRVDQRAVGAWARVRSVYGRRFTSANDVDRPHAVRLHRYRVRSDRHGLEHRFPAASTTLLRFVLR